MGALDDPLPERVPIRDRFFEPYPESPEGWEKFNAAYWRDHYDDFAENYSAENESSLLNAYYERPAMTDLAGDVDGHTAQMGGRVHSAAAGAARPSAALAPCTSTVRRCAPASCR